MVMGERLDNPNQQVVRPDGSGPADEGEGGSTHKKTKAKEAKPAKAKAKEEDKG
jgi:hypothetical protein